MPGQQIHYGRPHPDSKSVWLAAMSPCRAPICWLSPLSCSFTSPSCWGTHFLYLSNHPSGNLLPIIPWSAPWCPATVHPVDKTHWGNVMVMKIFYLPKIILRQYNLKHSFSKYFQFKFRKFCLSFINKFWISNGKYATKSIVKHPPTSISKCR